MVSIDVFVTTPFVYSTLWMICYVFMTFKPLETFRTKHVFEFLDPYYHATILSRDFTTVLLCGIKFIQALYPILFTTKVTVAPILDFTITNSYLDPLLSLYTYLEFVFAELYKVPVFTQDMVTIWLVVLIIATVIEFEGKLHKCGIYLAIMGMMVYWTIKETSYILTTTILPTVLLFTLIRAPEYILLGRLTNPDSWVRQAYLRFSQSIVWKIECFCVVTLMLKHIWKHEVIPDDAYWLAVLIVFSYFQMDMSHGDEEDKPKTKPTDLVIQPRRPHMFQRQAIEPPPTIVFHLEKKRVQEFQAIHNQVDMPALEDADD